jgi:hypothetical protein
MWAGLAAAARKIIKRGDKIIEGRVEWDHSLEARRRGAETKTHLGRMSCN